jgi:hypothetical protein
MRRAPALAAVLKPHTASHPFGLHRPEPIHRRFRPLPVIPLRWTAAPISAMLPTHGALAAGSVAYAKAAAPP